MLSARKHAGAVYEKSMSVCLATGVWATVLGSVRGVVHDPERRIRFGLLPGESVRDLRPSDGGERSALAAIGAPGSFLGNLDDASNHARNVDCSADRSCQQG